MSTTTLVCVAAGRGARFGGDKLAERVAGRTVLDRSLDALRRARPDDPLVVVLPGSRLEEWRERLAGRSGDVHLVAGGARRQDSVRAGVEAAADRGAEVVVVHDGARPLVAPDDVRCVLRALGDAAGAVLCSRVHDTVKRVDREGFVLETVPRDTLRLSQTPQVFRVAALARAWRQVDGDGEWTDEAALLESLGMPVRCVLARSPNPKLTTADDLRMIRALVEDRR